MASAILKLSEKDWQRRVIDCARLFNWRYTHFRPAMTAKGWRTAMQGDKGFPDLVLVKPPRVIFAELKSDDGNLTADQLSWISALNSSDVECYVWRPQNWGDVFACLAKDAT